MGFNQTLLNSTPLQHYLQNKLGKPKTLPRYFTHFFALILITASYPAHAVVIDGKDWAPMRSLGNVSYQTLDAYFDTGTGRCDHDDCVINGFDVSDYTWASYDDVRLMFESYLGVAIPIDPSTTLGNTQILDPWALDGFSSLLEPANSGGLAQGWVALTRSLFTAPATDTALLFNATDYLNTATSHPNCASLGGIWCANDQILVGGISFVAVDLAVWLYKEPYPSVPIPSAVWLFGSGLLGLIGFARRKNA